MLTALSKFPGPYYGGKRYAAPLVWRLLGDPVHYGEPLAGTCAVLLERPHLANRPYHSETVNDCCGLLINALRAIASHPDATAEAASWYVSEADLMARHLALLAWAATQPLEHLMGDPTWCDPQIGGWWLYGLSCWIGSGWCRGEGPWQVDPETGRVVRRPGGPGVSRQRPHLIGDGMGVQHAGTRAPGVWRQRPHLANNGKGVQHAGTRAPGVWRPDTPPGTSAEDAWQARVEADYAATDGFHPMTMPELRRWFHALSARLRHVRILHGDWRRAVTSGATKTVDVRAGKGICGLFMDPPYAPEHRAPGLYTSDRDPLAGTVAADVRTWCLTHGTDPDYRIVLAGFAGEGHEALEAQGWRVYEWFQAGHLRGGMGNTNHTGTHQQHRERLWASPHCLVPADAAAAQLALWEHTP
jgi:DNA adenine methylase